MPPTHPHRKDERRAPRRTDAPSVIDRPAAPPDGTPAHEREPAPTDRGIRPFERLRSLALSLERLAAQGVASGALRGAADELRTGLPVEMNARVGKLVEEVLGLMESVVHAAGEASASGTSLPRRAAAEVVRGTVEEMRRLVPDMQPMTQELLRRVKELLDLSASEAMARAEQIRTPGDRARIAAVGAVSGAMEQLAAGLPSIASPASEVASEIGRGLVRGTAQELGRNLRALGRHPVFRAVACGAVVVFLLARRRA